MSANGQGINVEIEGNTMGVANEVYNLGNIARVSTYTIRVSALKAIWARKGRFLLIAVATVGVVVGSSVARKHVTSDDGLNAIRLAERIGIGVLIFAAVLALLELIWALRPRATPHLLLIESSGVVRGLLASRDMGVIDQIAALIVESIRNPPITAVHRHFNNVTTNFNHNDVKNISQSGTGLINNRSCSGSGTRSRVGRPGAGIAADPQLAGASIGSRRSATAAQAGVRGSITSKWSTPASSSSSQRSPAATAARA
jgi:hypothetical protein